MVSFWWVVKTWTQTTVFRGVPASSEALSMSHSLFRTVAWTQMQLLWGTPTLVQPYPWAIIPSVVYLFQCYFTHSHSAFRSAPAPTRPYPWPQSLQGCICCVVDLCTATDALRCTCCSLDLSLGENPFRGVPAAAQVCLQPKTLWGVPILLWTHPHWVPKRTIAI